MRAVMVRTRAVLARMIAVLARMRAVVARTVTVMARLGASVAHLQTQRVIFAVPQHNGACVQSIHQTVPQNIALDPRNCPYEPESSKAQ
jgi:molybdopterin biosynthesis enzyme MoaB